MNHFKVNDIICLDNFNPKTSVLYKILNLRFPPTATYYQASARLEAIHNDKNCIHDLEDHILLYESDIILSIQQLESLTKDYPYILNYIPNQLQLIEEEEIP